MRRCYALSTLVAALAVCGTIAAGTAAASPVPCATYTGVHNRPSPDGPPVLSFRVTPDGQRVTDLSIPAMACGKCRT